VRRLAFVCLLLLLAVPVAAAAFPGESNDGTLEVDRGKGIVTLRITGSIIGTLARGRISAIDPDASDGSGPILKNCSHREDLSDQTVDPNDVRLLCSGSNLRFRLVGGFYNITIRGYGINVSAVGHGRVMLDGLGDDTGLPDGVYSFNGAPFQSLPDVVKWFLLAAPPGG
jgi:hypothetical protein